MKSQLIDNKKPLFLELQLVNTMASVYAWTSRQTQTHTHAHNISTHIHTHTPQHKHGKARVKAGLRSLCPSTQPIPSVFAFPWIIYTSKRD